jgi:diadenosine tetraphosphate (Ap4A) HIT family hydrolase
MRAAPHGGTPVIRPGSDLWPDDDHDHRNSPERNGAGPRIPVPGVDPCPFCTRVTEPGVLPRSAAAAVIADAYPRSQGHLLVVPLSHVGDYFAVPSNVKAEMWALVDSARSHLLAQYQPDGWTVRINIGEVAGQTVDHAHIHVVPHYRVSRPDENTPKETCVRSG